MSISDTIQVYGGDILASPLYARLRAFRHHGEINVYTHCLRVARFSVKLAHALRLRVNESALVRGALLHDYYLYDWHDPDPSHRLHGLFHPKKAMLNARRDFGTGQAEDEIILRHMFPLTLIPPRTREALLVCAADKMATVVEYWGGTKK
ncbi:MAG: HD domain-containing protein [bacterium]